MHPKMKYILVIITLIVAGLLSRKITFIPLWIGDSLWAMMIFYILRLFGNYSLKYYVILSIIICFGIEFSQLLHSSWLDMVRSYRVGRLVLGQGFLYTDLLAYCVGIFVIFLGEKYRNLSKKP